jgi:aspartate/methionine/tyrosine aminotransferase
MGFQGVEVYRESLVKYYRKNGIELKTNDIIVTTAGSEAITFAMMVGVKRRDESIVQTPFYTITMVRHDGRDKSDSHNTMRNRLCPAKQRSD